jgi:hypothetical protein
MQGLTGGTLLIAGHDTLFFLELFQLSNISG